MINHYYSSLASIENDIPVLRSVSNFLQYSASDLYKILTIRESGYKQLGERYTKNGYYLYKKNDRGKERIVTEPIVSLKKIQSNILHNIQSILIHKDHTYKALEKYGVYYNNADADTPGLSLSEDPRTKAVLHTQHTPNPYFINLDIKSAFESTGIEKVYGSIYNLLQYAKNQYMTKIFGTLSEVEFKKVCAIISHLVTFDNHLAIGAPTSPILFHTIIKETDKKIQEKLAATPIKNSVYTRYGDDMHISWESIETTTISNTNTFKKNIDLYSSIFASEIIEDKHIRGFELYLQNLGGFLKHELPKVADEHSKKYCRTILGEIRTALKEMKSLIPGLSEKLYGWMPDNEYKKQIVETNQEILAHQGISAEHLSDIIGLLDQYKRRLDKVHYTTTYSKENIADSICDVLEQQGRPINKKKIAVYKPHSATNKQFLGIGLGQKGDIIVSHQKFMKKIQHYKDLLLGKKSIPKKLQTRDGTLDYDKLRASVIGYVTYIHDIQYGQKNKALTHIGNTKGAWRSLYYMSTVTGITATQLKEISKLYDYMEISKKYKRVDYNNPHMPKSITKDAFDKLITHGLWFYNEKIRKRIPINYIGNPKNKSINISGQDSI